MGVDAILVLYRDGQDPVTYSPGRAYAFDAAPDSERTLFDRAHPTYSTKIPEEKIEPSTFLAFLDKLCPLAPDATEGRDEARRIVELWDKVYPGCLVQLTNESEIEVNAAMSRFKEWEDARYVLPLRLFP